MTFTMKEMVLGALLHDVGKILQRAYDSVEDVTGQRLDLESTLCPVRDGHYSHKHVLYTNAFFDLMRQEGLRFPEDIDIGVVESIASYHHKPEACDVPTAAWMCTLADWYSAGMDRRPDEEAGLTAKSRQAFRKIPLRCIFDEVVLDVERLGRPGRHAYRLGTLDPEDPESPIPVEWPQDGIDSELPEHYKAVWENFWKDFKEIARRADSLSFRLFEEMLLGLLERYTWAIPSSTMDSPDISLHDHSRTTAAIAACLHRYHDVQGQLQDLMAVRNKEQPKFRFLAGDLSGIQNTLFTLETQGVKGVNKILRSRSFMLGALTEAAVLELLEVFGLPLSVVLQQAGGRFLLLLPALEDCEPTVGKLRRDFDGWLLEHYTGTLSLNLALSDPFSGADFEPRRLREVMAQLGASIDRAKQRPLASCSQGVLKREFPLDKACAACGIRPADPKSENGSRCMTCEREFGLGRRLVRAKSLVWAKLLPRQWHPVPIFGLKLALLEKQPEEVPEGAVSIKRMETGDNGIPWAARVLANHIPVFPDAYALKDPRYQGIEGGEAEPGDPKSFQHIAAESLELDEHGGFRGKSFLGLLKADVDFLGFIFSSGLRRSGSELDRFSLSRVAQLSRMMDLFFTGYLKGLLHREFPDTYTVYAGGDDLLLIGPWRQTMALASRVNESFRSYTGWNPNITLSAGVTLLRPNYPVNRAVKEAEDFLERAKDSGRNRVCALIEKPIAWDRYRDRLEDADWIHHKMHGPDPVSTGFVYRLLNLTADAEAFVVGGNLGKAGWRARLAYHLARNVKARNQMERERQIVEWLKRLGLDDQLRLIQDPHLIFEWRLPLQIALYRNRS